MSTTTINDIHCPQCNFTAMPDPVSIKGEWICCRCLGSFTPLAATLSASLDLEHERLLQAELGAWADYRDADKAAIDLREKYFAARRRRVKAEEAARMVGN